MSSIYQPAEDSYLLSDVLKKQIPKLLKKKPTLKVLEVGPGSGILLQTILDTGVKNRYIFSCDVNPEVVKHCKKLKFNCVKSNLFEKIKGKYDVIIFNPPYLPESKKEPKESQIATTGGIRGGEVINEFLKQAREHLKPDGKIFLLTSSLTDDIDWLDYKKKKLGKKKLFFEKLYVWGLIKSRD